MAVSIIALANVVALGAMAKFWPSAGRSSQPHVWVALATVALSGATLLGLAFTASARSGRGAKSALGVTSALQALQLIPGLGIMAVWPGGDDGPGLLWLHFLVPYLGILALLGAVAWAWALSRWRNDPCP